MNWTTPAEPPKRDGSLLALGRFPNDAARRIETAAAAAGLTSRFSHGDEPLSVTGDEPTAVILPMNVAGADQACIRLRGQTRFASVPVFGVTSHPEDMSFIELFAFGGDDLVGLRAPEALTRRLRPLVGRPSCPVSVPGRAGSAIVASLDARWRSVIGRALHSGGYSVRFVTTARDLVEQLLEAVDVIVVADDVTPEGAVAVAASARARGSEAAWILVSPPKRMPAVYAALAQMPRTAVVDGFAPPENVLFRANELVFRRGPDQRAAPRLLYGTSVSFRAAGRDDDDVGFSYNVSSGGVYVRTLAPLESGQEVWLDMLAPRSQRRVRLAGTVAWRRVFGPGDKATVPPGFGVKLVDGLAGDLDRWRAGCEAFERTLFGESAGPAA
jgi:CheY-like chemotaxis protein/Tfp pilus assembly protein PilZ